MLNCEKSEGQRVKGRRDSGQCAMSRPLGYFVGSDAASAAAALASSPKSSNMYEVPTPSPPVQISWKYPETVERASDNPQGHVCNFISQVG